MISFVNTTTIAPNRSFILLLLLCGSLFSQKLDVVIPFHKKDLPTLEIVIGELKKYVKDIGDVYVVSKEKYTDEAIWVDEAIFPFSKDDTSAEVCGNGGIGKHRFRGWFYQQVLKFYAPFVIEGISDHVLIFDSDTVPTHEISFFDDDGKVLLDVVMNSSNLHTYNEHMLTIFPEFENFDQTLNPVNHHIVLSQDILKDLFKSVEEKFQKPFWKVFLNNVTTKYGTKTRGFITSASEYTIYTHFCLYYHPDKTALREITIQNRAKNLLKYRHRGQYDFVSQHNRNHR